MALQQIFQWFKKLKDTSNPYPDFSNDLLDDIIEKLDYSTISLYISENLSKNGINLKNAINIVKRLIDIIYYEGNINEDEQDSAIFLLQSLISDTENYLSKYPKQLKSFKKAYNLHLSKVDAIGSNSLLGKITNLPSKEVIPEIIKIENSTKLPKFLESLSKKDWDSIYPTVLKVLISDRRLRITDENDDLDRHLYNYVKFSNGVLTLHWLLIMRDKTAIQVINQYDKKSLYQIYTNYSTARQVLLKYDLFPKKMHPIPFQKGDPKTLPSILTAFIKHRALEETGLDIKDRYKILDKLDKEAREEIVFLHQAMRHVHCKLVIKEIYGADFQNEVLSLKEYPDLEEFCVAIENIINLYTEKDFEFGIHYAICIKYLQVMDDSTLSEDKRLEIISFAAECIKDDWIITAHRIRLILRCWGKYPKNDQEQAKYEIEDTVL